MLEEGQPAAVKLSWSPLSFCCDSRTQRVSNAPYKVTDLASMSSVGQQEAMAALSVVCKTATEIVEFKN